MRSLESDYRDCILAFHMGSVCVSVAGEGEIRRYLSGRVDCKLNYRRLLGLLYLCNYMFLCPFSLCSEWLSNFPLLSYSSFWCRKHRGSRVTRQCGTMVH